LNEINAWLQSIGLENIPPIHRVTQPSPAG